MRKKLVKRSGLAATFSIALAAFLALGPACRNGRESAIAPEVENLRALAKLYGYLKYFHPSDEAAGVNWDALAVHAAGKVKDAADSAALRAALEEVFRPIAPSLALFSGEEAPSAPAAKAHSPEEASQLASWQHIGAGGGSAGSIYVSVRLNRPYEADGGGNLGGHRIDVVKHAGKTVRMKAWAKVRTRAPGSRAQLWLRVDRASGAGFFDNMSDRPIRASEWTEYTIEGPLPEDARHIAFGGLVFGKGDFLFDDFRISVVDAKGRVEALRVANGGFEEGSIAAGTAPPAWGAQSRAVEFRVQAEDAHEGRRAFLFETKVRPAAEPLFEKRAPAGAVIDKAIGRGLIARVPLTLECDDLGTLPRAEAGDVSLEELKSALAALAGGPLSGAEENVRLGGIVIAWNVFQHFYPYFTVVDVDWDAVLTESLTRAISDRSEEEFLRTLRRLVARLADGHGGVRHAVQGKLGYPPFRIEWIEGRAVVLASRDNAFQRGDVVLEINGKKAGDIIREAEEEISGSPQWKRVRSTMRAQFGVGPAGTNAVAKVKRGRQTFEIALERSAEGSWDVPPDRQAIDTLEEGVFYVDLSRASWDDIKARIGELAAAKGVVFDLRGYPNGNHYILSHLLREPDKSSAWMKVPLVVLPDREGWTFQEVGWNMPTAEPRIEGRVVFITDGRAISYAESFMSFVEHYKLGEIVGMPTAGANGNVHPFSLPGGYSITWTGMKVVKHDGSQHHTIGILPTVPCERTIAGVAAGRDELLEKALEVINR